MGDKKAEQELIQTVTISDWPTRIKAAVALLAVDEGKALETFRQALSHTKGEDQLAAARHLALFQDATSAKVLVEFVESPKRKLSNRKDSVIALGHLNIPVARKALIKALEDRSPEVKLAAAVALID